METIKENSVVGNAAKLREALEKFVQAYGYGKCLHATRLAEAYEDAKVALSAPPRNCDIGSAEEQGARAMNTYNYWRNRFSNMSLINAVMAWAQMPYEEGGAK